MSGFLNQSQTGSQRNMFLAILLSLGVMLVWQAFMTPPPPPPTPEVAGSGEASAPAFEDLLSNVAPENAGSGEGDAAAPVAQIPEAEVLPPLVLRASNHDLIISNVGGRVQGVSIREPEQYVPRDTIIGVFPNAEEASSRLPWAIGIGGLPDLRESSTWSLVDSESRSSGEVYERIALQWTSPDGSIQVTRRFGPGENAFGVDGSVEVRNLGNTPRRFEGLVSSIYGEFATSGGGMFNRSASILEGVCGGEFGVKRRPARKIKELREHGSAEQTVQFGGVDEQYFLSALAPVGDTVLTRCAWDKVDENHVVTRLYTEPFELAPQQAQTFEFAYYTGPKHDTYLDPFPGNIGRAVDFGLFSFLALPIRFFLLLFHGWVGNWGLSIILLTFFIKILLFPVTQKGYTSMEKMKRVQPKLSELQKRYENDRMKLAEEQMKLFKEEGVSPMGGCLPMLAQMPIYFALYRTIWGSAELYNAPFAAWVSDLSQPDPFFILPILMGATMIIQTRLMPQAVDNPQIRMMNRIMPIMFTAMMLFLPSGLVLYIFVNMLLSIFQMLYIRKQHGAPAAVTPAR